ncbi:unnamed protein product, partial [Musa banksii]
FLFPVGSRFLASLGSCCQFLVQRKFESLRSFLICNRRSPCLWSFEFSDYGRDFLKFSFPLLH